MENVSSGAAAEIASQILRANDAAQKAAQLPEATSEDVKAAEATNIIATQAVADALVKQTIDSKENAYYAEQNATYLKQKADASQLPADNNNASLSAQRLKDANDKLMLDAKNTNDAILAANVTLSQAQSDSAALALAASLSTVKFVPKVAKISLFNRIVNYIYNNLYKNK
jgi:hypothetical protein